MSSSASQGAAHSTPARPPTAIVMMNMGGPATPDAPTVESFLTNLFSDPMIINLGSMQWLGKYAAQRRTPKIVKQYEAIGGSPIRKWTEIQGRAMTELLDKISPETAPHKAYVMFRYADPLTEETVDQLLRDKVERAVLFSQYPMFSCTTTGSSINHLWEVLRRRGAEKAIRWSVIDRWNAHEALIRAVARRVRMGLAKVPAQHRKDAVLLFSAHSIPVKTHDRGDHYSQEISHVIGRVAAELASSDGVADAAAAGDSTSVTGPVRIPHLLSWQSKVGYLPWLSPSTAKAIEGLAKSGRKHVVVVPIAFTSDHIETLFEIDIEYAHLAKSLGIETFVRAPSLNDEPLFIRALATIAKEHMDSRELHSSQYPLKCFDCVNPGCRTVLNPIERAGAAGAAASVKIATSSVSAKSNSEQSNASHF